MDEIQKAFRLKKNLPDLPKGAIFVLNYEKIPYGLYLAWDKGNCQSNWCGGAYRFSFQVADNCKWFEEIPNPDGRYSYKLTRTTKTFEIITD